MYLCETGNQQAARMEQHSSCCCQQFPLLVAAEDIRVSLCLLPKQAPTGSVKGASIIHSTSSTNGKLWNSLLSITPEDCQEKTFVAEMSTEQSLLCNWSVKSPVSHRIQTHGLYKGSFPSTCTRNFTMERLLQV